MAGVVATAAPSPASAQTLEDAPAGVPGSVDIGEVDPFADPDSPTRPPEPGPAVRSAKPIPAGVPKALELEADQQGFDAALQRFTARGNVTLLLAGGRLQADRLEYDSRNQVIWARGAVRFARGNQYLQASLLRFNLLQGEGELEDAYGVVDLRSSEVDFDPDAPLAVPFQGQQGTGLTARQRRLERERLQEELASSDLEQLRREREAKGTATQVQPLAPPEPMACPPELPALRSRLPGPWSVTAWGGQMSDATFGETFLFSGAPRPEYLGGLGFTRRLLDADPLALELDGNVLFHTASRDRDLKYALGVPEDERDRASTDPQNFWEGTLGIALRWWIQPWISLAVVEGVSLNSTVSDYERTSWPNSTQFLNYLAAEIAVNINPRWSLVGRIHHRSGAYGTYSGVEEGSNGYLIGVRYSFGDPVPQRQQEEQPPALGCPDPNRSSRERRLPLEEQLEAVVFDGPSAQQAPAARPAAPDLSADGPSAAEQLRLRRQAIAAIDQRVTDVLPREGLGLSTSLGSNDFDRLSRREQQFSVSTPQNQLRALSQKADLVSGTITHWRFQSPRLVITPDGWRAGRLSFTSDPFTPAQAWVDAEDVVANQEEDGTTVIVAQRNRLLLENKLPIPLSRTVRFSPEEEEDSVSNRWALLVDERDRDGIYLQYTLPNRRIGKRAKLSLRPQFLIQRAFEGETESYPEPNAKPGAPDISQPADAADLFGLDARLDGEIADGSYNLRSSISSFNPNHLPNAVRASGIYTQPLELPLLGSVQGRAFSAYRYRVWNGSLGLQNIYSAFGGSIEKSGRLPELAGLQSIYFWRVEAGNYQSNAFQSTDFTEQFRGTAYGTLRLNWPIWRGEALPLTPEGAYRYSAVPIIPGLNFEVVPYASLSSYADGDNQNLLGISGGPSITLGHFSRPFLDYTKLAFYGSVTAKSGESPFSFDEFVDIGTLGVNLTQQLVGPLVLQASIGYNVAGDSGYYGEVTNALFGLQWQRRAYQIEAYFSPYTGMGGLRVRLNDFGFKGTGVPFVPYDYSPVLRSVPGAEPSVR